MKTMVTGGCLCGTVKFQITGELNKIQICHCRQCRRAQGSAFAANIPVASGSFTITTGKSELKSYESATRPGKFRVFCSQCGSPIISHLRSDPTMVRVRAGSVDEPLESDIAHHQFVAFKALWLAIHGGAPQYDEYP